MMHHITGNKFKLNFNLFRRIFASLIALEADYDKKAKEALSCPVGKVRWDISLNKKVNATFQLPESRDGSMFCFCMINKFIDWRLMIGDDLRLKHRQTIDGSEWTAQGRIIKVPDSRFFN